MFGDATDSKLSVTGNSDQTIATGNLASGNLLTVRADTIDARQGDPLGVGTAGTAITTPAGSSSTAPEQQHEQLHVDLSGSPLADLSLELFDGEPLKEAPPPGAVTAVKAFAV